MKSQTSRMCVLNGTITLNTSTTEDNQGRADPADPIKHTPLLPSSYCASSSSSILH